MGGDVCVCFGNGGGFACQEVANRLYEFDGKAGVNVGHWWDSERWELVSCANVGGEVHDRELLEDLQGDRAEACPAK